MTLSAVATRYANALADVVTAAKSPVAPQQALAELRSFLGVLESSPELHNALITPAVAGSRKKAVVSRIGDVLKLSRIARNFLFVLLDNRRIALLPEIVETFETVVDERLGFARAEISSASELSDAQRAALLGKLEALSGKRIRPRYSVDGALLGGAVARIGSTVYDGSIRGQLDSLGRRLNGQS
jgi:F-type H+-transporting ATPase subunit delta